jgi:hypothetical protein
MSSSMSVQFRSQRRYVYLRLLSVMLCFLYASACSVSQRNESPDNAVLVLGSLHGWMLDHPHYKLPVFVDVIERFRPDVILTEVRPEHLGAIDGSIDGGIEQALVYAIGELRGVPVVAVDWFDDAYIAAIMAESAISRPVLESAQAHLWPTYQEILASGTFEAIQSAETQAIARKLYDLDDQYGSGVYNRRNRRICQNAVSQLNELHGKRALIVFGLDHKYFLDDCVVQAGNRLEVAPATSGTKQLPGDIRDRAVLHVRASKAALQEKLANGFYSKTYAERLTNKVSSFDRWIDRLSSD